MKKICFICFSLLLSSLILTGCGTSDKPGLVVKNQGKKNAIEYIEKKYGQTPKVKKTKLVWGSGYAPAGCLPKLSDIGPNGKLRCTMELNGEEFSLVIDGDTKDYRGYDDYEKNIITDAIISDISSSLNISCESYGLKYRDSSKSEKNQLVNIKYESMDSFLRETTTIVYFLTTDDIDEALLAEYADKYEIPNKNALYRIYLLRYDDESSIPYIDYWDSDFKPEYDDHVLSYYDLYISGFDTIERINHIK